MSGEILGPAPVGPTPMGPEETTALRQTSAAGDVWRRFRRDKLAVFGLVIIVLLVLTAAFAPLIAPYSIEAESESISTDSLQPPSAEHLMGTDLLGRDQFSRIVYGARISLKVGILAVSIELFIGLALGALAGFYGGWPDTLVMRLADIFFAFPYALGAIALVTAVRSEPFLAELFANERAVILAIGLLAWPFVARVFRSSILAVRRSEYVEAARVSGAGDFRIMWRHILPNSIQPIIVYGTMSVGAAIIAEAALSFLGLGVQPPTPSWGLMLAQSSDYISNAPWLMVFPGLAILLSVLAFVLLGDGLRDALDPRLKER